MTRTSRRRRDLAVDLSGLPLALYARLSQNPDGERESVPTQLSIGRKRAAESWPGREIIEYADDGFSASHPDIWRPAYEQMLDDLARRKIGGVLARNQGRISRHDDIWRRWKTTNIAVGITTLHTWTEGDIQFGEGESFGSDMKNLFNAEHPIQTRIAVLDTQYDYYLEGRPAGGRPYGYVYGHDGNVKTLVQVTEQADLIHELADRVLAGESMASMVRDLNARCVPTARKAKNGWTSSSVKGILTSPTTAGHLVRHKVDSGVKGIWTPIMEEDKWMAVKATLNQKRTVVKSDGSTYQASGTRRESRRYLLTGGIIRCGRPECGLPMTTQTQPGRDGIKKPIYFCSSTRGGCNKIGIMAIPTEERVGERVKEHLSDKSQVRYLLEQEDVDAKERERLNLQKVALERKRIETAALTRTRADGTPGMSPALAYEIDRGIDADLALVNNKMAALVPLRAARFNFEDISTGWDDLDLAEQRAILFHLQCEVVIRPTSEFAGPRNKFNPDRIEVRFGRL